MFLTLKSRVRETQAKLSSLCFASFPSLTRSSGHWMPVREQIQGALSDFTTSSIPRLAQASLESMANTSLTGTVFGRDQFV